MYSLVNKNLSLRQTGKWIMILFLGYLMASCAPTKKAAYLRNNNEVQDINNADKIYFIEDDYSEVIHAGDELYISVTSGNDDPNSFNQPRGIPVADPELFSYTVDDDGYIKLPYVNRILLEGFKIKEAVDTLEKVLSEYLYLPAVDIRFVVSRVAILGEVNTPGLYVFNRKSINIFQALAYASDITVFGNRKKVMIVRQEGSNIQKKYVDLTNDKIITSSWYLIQPNDIIYVEPLGRRKWGMETFPWGLVFTIVGTATMLITFMFTVLY
jgi:polysaccharide biosynthesis/export protein